MRWLRTQRASVGEPLLCSNYRRRLSAAAAKADLAPTQNGHQEYLTPASTGLTITTFRMVGVPRQARCGLPTGLRFCHHASVAPWLTESSAFSQPNRSDVRSSPVEVSGFPVTHL